MASAPQSKRRISVGRLITGPIRFVASFFKDLRDVDVDAVGRAVFKHCTNPKALYVTIFERWWIVGLCATMGAALGVFMILQAVKKYESHGGMLIYQKMPSFVDENNMIPDPKAYDSLFGTHVQLIGSPLIVEKAIEEHDLEERCPKIVHEVEHAEEKTTFEKYILSNLKVSRAGSGDSAGAFVVNVGFDHVSDSECPIIVDAILETYHKHVNQSLLFDQQEALDLVEKRKQNLESEYRKKGEAYRAFLKSAPGVWNRMTENNSHYEVIEQLRSELTQLEIKRIGLVSRIKIMGEKTDEATGRPLTALERMALIEEDHISRLEMLSKARREEITNSNHQQYPQLQEYQKLRYDMLLRTQGEMAELLGNIGPTHPRIKDMQKSIDKIKEELDSIELEDQADVVQPEEVVAAYERMLDKELCDVDARVAYIKQRIEEEIEKSQELTDFTIEAKRLEEEYNLTIEMYKTATAKVNEQNLLTEYGNFVVEIVSRPHVGKLTWPKKPVILALCTIMGIFIGSFLALCLDLIAYTPMRSVFWFLPRWLLGGTPTKKVVGSEKSTGSEDREG